MQSLINRGAAKRNKSNKSHGSVQNQGPMARYAWCMQIHLAVRINNTARRRK